MGEEMSENIYTSKDLADFQSLSLDAKISHAVRRINEFYSEMNGQVYVSFSGGKDSTVLLDLVRREYPDTPAVFVDTGLEYPEIREFVKTFDNVTWLKPEMNFRKVIETYGYPLISKEVSQKICEARQCPNGVCAGRFENNNEHNIKYGNRYSMAKWKPLRDSDIPISHKCCDVMKKKPAKKFERQTGLKPITGTMACESQLRRLAWLKHGCNSYDVKRQSSAPLSIWTTNDVLEYIFRFNLPYCNVYGEIVKKDGKYVTTGCQRTGCVFCGFGAHLDCVPNRFQRLAKTHPKLWEYCMRDWDKGGLGMREPLEFIGVDVDPDPFEQISIFEEDR